MDFHYKVLVIEDDDSISCFVKNLLVNEGYDVIVANNGRDAAIFASSHCPDLILLDLCLPDADGVDVLRQLRSWSSTPVIVVSSKDLEQDKVRALENGADDYVQKPFNNQEFLARVRVALRHVRNYGTNKAIAQNARFEVGGLVIDYAKYRVYVDGVDAELTQNEFRLVAYLGQFAGHVITYEDLIRKMWGPNARTDNQILRVNMANIRRKIEKDPAHPRYIFTETGVGYRMAEE